MIRVPFGERIDAPGNGIMALEPGLEPGGDGVAPHVRGADLLHAGRHDVSGAQAIVEHAPRSLLRADRRRSTMLKE